LLWTSTLTNQFSNLELFCFQGEWVFQCLMVKLNGCLCVMAWMWHLSKTHHWQIYNNMHNAPIGITWIFGVFTLVQGMNIF
jgi:hypothetical protein